MPKLFATRPIDLQAVFLGCGLAAVTTLAILQWSEHSISILGLALTFHCARICSLLLRESQRQRLILERLTARIDLAETNSIDSPSE